MFVNQIHQKSEKVKEKIDMENSVQKARKSAGELGTLIFIQFLIRPGVPGSRPADEPTGILKERN